MASPSAARMFGFAFAEAMIGIEAATIYRYPEDRQAIVEEIYERGHIEDRILEGKRKDGTTFWVSLNARTYCDEQGRLRGTEGFLRDITERKRAESNYRLIAETVQLWNRGGDVRALVGTTIRIIKVLTGFDAVGLRLARERISRITSRPDFPRTSCWRRTASAPRMPPAMLSATRQANPSWNVPADWCLPVEPIPRIRVLRRGAVLDEQVLATTRDSAGARSAQILETAASVPATSQLAWFPCDRGLKSSVFFS